MILFQRLALSAMLLIVPPIAGHGAVPEIVAHRGASHEAPENTLAAVRLAWDLGADAAEVDVFLTADGRIVAMHDQKLERTTGHPGDVRKVDWATLRDLDAGAWKGPRWIGEPIPTLEALLRTIPDGKRLFVEVKHDVEIIPALVRTIGASGKQPAQVAIISFDHKVCVTAKRALPAHKVYFLSGFKENERTGEVKPSFDELIARAKAGNLDGIDISRKGPITAENVARAHAAGLEVHVYTVNDIEEARRLAAAGVNGITTDRPDYLMDEAFGLTRVTRR